MKPIRQAPIDLVQRELRPEQQLAGAVLAQAVADLHDPTITPLERDRARHFLVSSAWLAFWCAVAGVDLAVVREQSRALVK